MTAAAVVLTHRRYLDNLRLTFPSWDEHFLSPRQAVVIQAHAGNFYENDIVTALRLRRSACTPPTLQESGWQAYLTQRDHLVLLTVRALMVPPQLESMKVAEHLRPPSYKSCHRSHKAVYSLGTKWYSYEMLNLEALDYFDFVWKLDTDTGFAAPMRQTIADYLVSNGGYWLSTGSGPKYDTPGCTTSLPDATESYLRAAGCSKALLKHQELTHPYTFGSCFVGGWLGLLQSPQFLSYAQFWWTWPGGWTHRWGDQQFWTHALAVCNATEFHINIPSIRLVLNTSSHCRMAAEPVPTGYDIHQVKQMPQLLRLLQRPRAGISMGRRDPSRRPTRSLPVLHYAAHSGWGNQMLELARAKCLAEVLNRSLVWPAVMKHYDIALGRCSLGRTGSAASMWSRYLTFSGQRPPLSAFMTMTDSSTRDHQEGAADGFSCTPPHCFLTRIECNKSFDGEVARLRHVETAVLVLGTTFPLPVNLPSSACPKAAPPQYRNELVRRVRAVVVRALDGGMRAWTGLGVTALPSTFDEGYDAIHLRGPEGRRRSPRDEAARESLSAWLHGSRRPVFIATDDMAFAEKMVNASLASWNEYDPRPRFFSQRDLPVNHTRILAHLQGPQRKKAAFMVPLLVDVIACINAERFWPSSDSTLSRHIAQQRHLSGRNTSH